MTEKFKKIADEVGAGVGQLRERAPKAMKGFAAAAVGATATRFMDTRRAHAGKASAGADGTKSQ